MTYFGTDQNDVLSQSNLGLADWEMIDALAGNDTVTGGNTNLQGGAGNDTLIGTTSYSSAVYFSSPNPIQADLGQGRVQDGWGNIDTLIDITSIQGTSYADTITGSSAADMIAGNLGGDLIDGGPGRDTARYWGRSTDFRIEYNAQDNKL